MIGLARAVYWRCVELSHGALFYACWLASPDFAAESLGRMVADLYLTDVEGLPADLLDVALRTRLEGPGPAWILIWTPAFRVAVTREANALVRRRAWLYRAGEIDRLPSRVIANPAE